MHSGRDAGHRRHGLHAAVAGRHAHRRAQPDARDDGGRDHLRDQHRRALPLVASSARARRLLESTRTVCATAAGRGAAAHAARRARRRAVAAAEASADARRAPARADGSGAVTSFARDAGEMVVRRGAAADRLSPGRAASRGRALSPRPARRGARAARRHPRRARRRDRRRCRARDEPRAVDGLRASRLPRRCATRSRRRPRAGTTRSSFRRTWTPRCRRRRRASSAQRATASGSADDMPVRIGVEGDPALRTARRCSPRRGATSTSTCTSCDTDANATFARGSAAGTIPIARAVDARFVSPRVRGWREDAQGIVDYARVKRALDARASSRCP